tara:strand:+ start:3298 stop:4443 length:1146 start_codon:yes stop_codon:yes gene_type:complete
MLVLADENIPQVEATLGPTFRVQRFRGRELSAERVAEADALLVRSVTPVHAGLLERSSVRFVGTATSGLEHIDRDYLSSRGVGFAHAPGANANSVVEYVLAAIAHCDGMLERLLDDGRVGVVGYGHIGRALVSRLHALGIASCVYDPWLPRESVPNAADFATVLGCDVISLHCELTHRKPWPSRHLIHLAELEAIAPQSLLINASRGSVVDNAALLRHLRRRQGPAVVLDVWEGEPDINAALLDYVSLGTAHIAGYSYDGKLRATQMLCAALAAHMRCMLPGNIAVAPATNVLWVRPGLAGAQLLRFLLTARYDIAADDALLRQAVAPNAMAPAPQGFDRLRREYPERRELAGSTVSGVDLDAEAVALVEAMGCRYVVHAP